MPENDTRPGTTTSHRPDKILYPESRPDDNIIEEDLTEKMIRRPTEEDFEDVLTPEGDSGDIVGTAISDSTVASDASVTGPE